MALTKVPENLEKLNDEALSKLSDAVAAEALEAKDNARRVSHEVSRRTTTAAARAKFDALTAPERAALAQIVAAEGIETEEKV